MLAFFSPSVIIVMILMFVVVILLIISSRLMGGVKRSERHLIQLYIEKIGKVPALVETLRPFVADDRAFDTITRLHREAMIGTYQSIYDILGQNLAIQKEFEFLMKLSMQIPEIQKKEYFLYIRDFIMKYERAMRAYFSEINHAIQKYNTFIRYKNLTLIGLLVPGERIREIETSA